MKILISTWGNPKNWEEVIYNYKEQTSEPKDPLKDPLPLLKEKENIEKVIIISIDTLFDESLNESTGSQSFTYDFIRERAEKIIKDFCNNELNCEPDKIIISYGVGEFNKTKFIGNAIDFYYSVFKELSFIFVKWFEDLDSQNKLEFYLDISHGINFLPVLTYRALKEILQILAYIFEIKLTVLNSDTFIRTARPSELNVNIIEETNILPRIFVYKYDKRPIEPFDKLSDNEKREIGKKLPAYSRDQIHCFLSSFAYCLPLYVISYMLNHRDVENHIKDFCDKYEKNIVINQNLKIEIERKVQFTISFENLVKTFLVSWLLSKNGFSQKEDIDLEEIKNLKEKIWKNFRVESNRIDREIKDIKESIENLSSIEETYKSYAAIKGKEQGIEINERNFFAHAGFEYNSFMIRRNKDKIELKINKDFEDKLKAIIENNLPRG